MKIIISDKEFDLPEEFIKLLHINKSVINTETREKFHISYLVNGSNSISVARYLNTLEWDLTVRQPSYAHDKKYGKEARANIKRLRAEGNEIRRYLEFVLGKELRKFICPEIMIAIKDGQTNFTEIPSNTYYIRYMKEVNNDE